jgi:hypothetical protein
MKFILELDEQEKNWWKNTIKSYRDKFIQKPSFYFEKYLSENNIQKEELKKDISGSIPIIREGAWQLYLVDEVILHQKVLAFLTKERDLPIEILNRIVSKKLLNHDKINITKENLHKKLAEVVGEYAGAIMPYIYELCLSTTQSRRSRAGKTFEAIIKYLIVDIYGYSFDDQSKIGTNFYKLNNLGKVVDGVIPSKEAYLKDRSKCQVITMKTTLRERWQEVIEELERTNIPHLYLLTIDEGITKTVLETMAHKNITLINYDHIKEKFKELNNIKSYAEFFNTEIPHCVSYWEKQK